MQTQLLAGWGHSRVIKTDSLIRPPCAIIAKEYSVITVTVNGDFFNSLNRQSQLRYQLWTPISLCVSWPHVSLDSRGGLLTRASLFFLNGPDQHLYTRQEFPSKWGLQFPRVKFRKIQSRDVSFTVVPSVVLCYHVAWPTNRSLSLTKEEPLCADSPAELNIHPA